MKYKGQTSYPHDKPKAPKGILLVNLGTPDAPTKQSLRKYLKEFLSDPRVVEIPRLIWLTILYCFILPIRPKRSAQLYESVWDENGSPLLSITREQQKALQAKHDKDTEHEVKVVVGMRYGNPSISSALEELTENNVRDITVIPLYPQYSGATTGSTFDALSKALTQYRWVPSLRFINGYHSHPSYLSAISNTIDEYISQSGMPELILFSYHGVPQRYLEQGDPYYCFCMQTTRLVSQKLGLKDGDTLTTFQSRFGKATWLQPYTDSTLKELAEKGVRRVAVICPGFASDCLETLEEIVVENRNYFIESGGEVFDYIPCLNKREDHIKMLFSLTESAQTN